MLILPVGIPGCGKTTLAEELVKEGFLHPDAIVSPDRYREILTGDRGNQDVNGDAWEITRKIATFRLRYRQDVYLDATNLVRNWYKNTLYTADLHGHKVAYIYFDNTLEAQMRNIDRGPDRAVPKAAMLKMLDRFKQVDFVGFGDDMHRMFRYDSGHLIGDLGAWRNGP